MVTFAVKWAYSMSFPLVKLQQLCNFAAIHYCCKQKKRNYKLILPCDALTMLTNIITIDIQYE